MKYISLSFIVIALVIAGCKNEDRPDRQYRTYFNVRDFGAVGDGTNKDTIAFQKAFDACATAHDGGAVLVLPGHYLIGSVQMNGDTVLLLRKGSVIIGSGD